MLTQMWATSCYRMVSRNWWTIPCPWSGMDRSTAGHRWAVDYWPHRVCHRRGLLGELGGRLDPSGGGSDYHESHCWEKDESQEDLDKRKYNTEFEDIRPTYSSGGKKFLYVE